MSVPWNREGFHTITPNLIVSGVEKAIQFYKAVFDAEEKMRLTMPDGTIVHCELAVGDSRLNIGETTDGWPPHPLLAQLHVRDADALFERAVNAGAKVVTPMSDTFFGSREGRVADPFGGMWTICTRTAIVSPKEMQQRLNAAAAGDQA